MCDPNHHNQEVGVSHSVEDAVITLANAILLLAGEFFASGRPRVRAEALNPGNNTAPIFERECFQFFGRYGLISGL